MGFKQTVRKNLEYQYHSKATGNKEFQYPVKIFAILILERSSLGTSSSDVWQQLNQTTEFPSSYKDSSYVTIHKVKQEETQGNESLPHSSKLPSHPPPSSIAVAGSSTMFDGLPGQQQCDNISLLQRELEIERLFSSSLDSDSYSQRLQSMARGFRPSLPRLPQADRVPVFNFGARDTRPGIDPSVNTLQYLSSLEQPNSTNPYPPPVTRL